MSTPETRTRSMPIDCLSGFIAAFFASLIFHQLTAALLWKMGIAPGPSFQFDPRPPFGVPAVISLAFWGGVWGVFFAVSDRYFPRRNGYWLVSFLWGAILPSLVALLIVVPLKGGPMGAGWMPKIWLYAFLVNGAWGIGTGLILRKLRKFAEQSRY